MQLYHIVIIFWYNHRRKRKTLGSCICLEVLAALVESNSGSALAYGNDEYTHRVSQKIREIFECDFG